MAARKSASTERQGENNQYDDAGGLSQHSDAVAQVLQEGLHRLIAPLCAFRTMRVDAISAEGLAGGVPREMLSKWHVFSAVEATGEIWIELNDR